MHRLPSPGVLRNRVHPLVSFTPLQSPPVPCPPWILSVQSSFLGVGFPLRDISLQRLASGFHPRRCPSSAFRTPSTVCSATGLAGLFHPAAASRVLPFRVFPSRHSRTGSSPARALSSVGCSRLRTVARSRQLPQPRPQGFTPCRESVACTPVLPDAPPVPLVGFVLLQVFPLPTVESTLMPSSDHGLREESVAVVLFANLRRVAGEKPGLRLPTPPTCSRFLPAEHL